MEDLRIYPMARKKPVSCKQKPELSLKYRLTVIEKRLGRIERMLNTITGATAYTARAAERAAADLKFGRKP